MAITERIMVGIWELRFLIALFHRRGDSGLLASGLSINVMNVKFSTHSQKVRFSSGGDKLKTEHEGFLKFFLKCLLKGIITLN